MTDNRDTGDIRKHGEKMGMKPSEIDSNIYALNAKRHQDQVSKMAQPGLPKPTPRLEKPTKTTTPKQPSETDQKERPQNAGAYAVCFLIAAVAVGYNHLFSDSADEKQAPNPEPVAAEIVKPASVTSASVSTPATTNADAAPMNVAFPLSGKFMCAVQSGDVVVYFEPKGPSKWTVSAENPSLKDKLPIKLDMIGIGSKDCKEAEGYVNDYYQRFGPKL